MLLGNLYFDKKTKHKQIHICDVACQKQAFVAEMICSVMMFLGNLIYYLCVYALPVQSYAPCNKLLYLTYTKSLNREKGN